MKLPILHFTVIFLPSCFALLLQCSLPDPILPSCSALLLQCSLPTFVPLSHLQFILSSLFTIHFFSTISHTASLTIHFFPISSLSSSISSRLSLTLFLSHHPFLLHHHSSVSFSPPISPPPSLSLFLSPSISSPPSL